MSFRNNLQHLRATRNMTQEQLAMLLGVSRQSVTKWEAEKSQPEMDKLLKICGIFGCTLDDLVTGDLTDRPLDPEGATVPAGSPTDVCGYDEHQRMMAWKVPTGIALILVGIAIGLLFEGMGGMPMGADDDAMFVIIVLAGILAGLVLLVPAGMDHTAFVKAHPFVEDFYTEEDRADARKAFSAAVVAGAAFIFAGVGCLLMIEGSDESLALFFLLIFVAIGVWNIVHYGMLFGRTDVAEYNRSAASDLEIDEIIGSQVSDEIKEGLIDRRRRSKKVEAICGTIMIVSTIVGLGLLFLPALTAPDPSSFEPEGTPTMWFWLAWPVGGMLCGIVSILWEAFGKGE
ncbi:MAG: helix-turn-helix transcriptional regulator [Collinsella sp.]|nr:helix-turn-helix transcriptional regulator [Collinsella sp.]